MKLDIADTVLSSLNRIASKASLGVLGTILAVLIVSGGLGAASTALLSTNVILGGLVGIAALVAYFIGVAALTVGSMRAFDQKDFDKQMFTEDIFWPFLRMTGANITLQSFMLTAIYIVAYPLLLVGLGGSLTMAAAGTGLGTAATALAGAAGILSLAIILYVMSALVISLPRIAVNDKRLFQALDESVQVTKGNRLRIVITLVPFAMFIGAAITGVLMETMAGFALYGASALISGLYMLALLTELNDRLQ